MADNYAKKLDDGAIKKVVNDMVEARMRDGKVHENAYTSITEVHCELKSAEMLYTSA